jgi:tetratricopeptide (TPR) repeat protein
MDNPSGKVKIFISYARQDKAIVDKLYSGLANAGFQPWMDTEDILPGQDWSRILRKTIKDCHLFIFCISRNSVDKRGFIQREIREALDVISEKLDDDIFIIPVRIEATCDDMPDSIRKYNRVDLFEENGFEKLRKAIIFQAERLGMNFSGDEKKIDVNKSKLKETSFSVLGRLETDEIRKIMNNYKTATLNNPEDGDAYYSLALCYLQMKIYDLAIKSFKRSFELMPDFADGYYYYSLSLIRGRRPKTLSLDEVKNIEQHINAAIQLDEKQAKYYLLAAILRFDYYQSNGLTAPAPSYEELLITANEKDKEYDPWEIERLVQGIILRDNGLISTIRRS